MTDPTVKSGPEHHHIDRTARKQVVQDPPAGATSTPPGRSAIRREPQMNLIETLDHEQPATTPCKTPSPDPATIPNCVRPADHKISAAAARESHAAPVDGTWITWLDQN